MARQTDAHSERPPEPALAAPVNSRAVDGEAVTLFWEPVDGAQTYHVEVATDTDFDELVVDADAGAETQYALEALPADDTTYYWRVLVKTDLGWSAGERVESFISATPEELEAMRQHAASTDRPEEGYGPYPALIRSAAGEAAAEAKGGPSRERLEAERRMGVAHEGVEAGQIMGIAGSIIVAIIIIALLLFFWVTQVSQLTRQAAAANASYPGLHEAELEAVRQLEQYGVVDPAEDVYRIPIKEAMRIMVNEEYQQTEQTDPLELAFPMQEAAEE